MQNGAITPWWVRLIAGVNLTDRVLRREITEISEKQAHGHKFTATGVHQSEAGAH